MAQILRNWTATWTATGKATIDRIIDRTSTLEFNIPLRQPSSAAASDHGDQHAGGKVTLIELLRGGDIMTATVDLTDISSDRFKDFPFSAMNVGHDSGEEVQLVATYTQPPGWPAIVCGQQAKIKVQGDTTDLCLNLDVEWTWNNKVYLEQGTVYWPVIPLTWEGDDYKGWEKTVSVLVRQPNGEVLTNSTADFAHHINADWPEEAELPTFPASGEYEFTVTAKRSRS